MTEITRERMRIGFVLEYSLGHLTHAQNIRHWIDQYPDIEPHWMLVPYEARDLWERLPGMPFSLKLSLRARRLYRETLSHTDLDCIFFHTQALALFSLELMKTVPTIISLDATPENFKAIASAYDAQPATGIIDQFKTNRFRKIFSHATGLVAISNWVKESLVQDYGVTPGKIAVVPWGVDITQWQPTTRERAPGGSLRLLFVGGDFTRKGGHVLLKAFREGLSDICELDIVTMDETIASEGSIRIHTGLTPNAPLLMDLYARADLFILPTEGDSHGIAILEAMASALPVITTDIGALGELVDDGVTGYMVPQNDAKAIVDRVAALARQPEQLTQMGTAARLRVERDFNAETNYQQLIALIKELSGLRPAASTEHSQSN